MNSELAWSRGDASGPFLFYEGIAISIEYLLDSFITASKSRNHRGNVFSEVFVCVVETTVITSVSKYMHRQ
jgi:hypothetical protein